MNIIEKLLTVLDHSLMTNEEFAEDDELVPGVSISEVKEMIEMLQPVNQKENYKKLLEDTLLTMDVHVVNLQEDIYRDEQLERYDLTVMYGDTISRIPMNADLYSDFTVMINGQLDWEPLQ